MTKTPTTTVAAAPPTEKIPSVKGQISAIASANEQPACHAVPAYRVVPVLSSTQCPYEVYSRLLVPA